MPGASYGRSNCWLTVILVTPQEFGADREAIRLALEKERLSGFKPHEDIEIKFMGLRPGEKLYEELITEGEGIVRTDYKNIFVLKGNGPDLHWLNQRIVELTQLAYEQDASGIKAKLKEIVPEYQPFDMNNFNPPRNH